MKNWFYTFLGYVCFYFALNPRENFLILRNYLYPTLKPPGALMESPRHWTSICGMAWLNSQVLCPLKWTVTEISLQACFLPQLIFAGFLESLLTCPILELTKMERCLYSGFGASPSYFASFLDFLHQFPNNLVALKSSGTFSQ